MICNVIVSFIYVNDDIKIQLLFIFKVIQLLVLLNFHLDIHYTLIQHHEFFGRKERSWLNLDEDDQWSTSMLVVKKRKLFINRWPLLLGKTSIGLYTHVNPAKKQMVAYCQSFQPYRL